MLLSEAKEIINIYNEGFLKTAGKAALVGGAIAGGVAAAPYVAKAAAPMIAKAAPFVKAKMVAAKNALGVGKMTPTTGVTRVPNFTNPVGIAKPVGIAPGTSPLRIPNAVKPPIITKPPIGL